MYWETLLKKYMLHVLEQEGTTFTSRWKLDLSGLFTAEEKATLQACGEWADNEEA